MFDMLGYEATDDILFFGEVKDLIHPEDIDLFDLAERAAAQEIRRVDQLFRMRHAAGQYRWMRIRTELVEKGGSGIHLIGIAVDVTEQQRLADENAIANDNLRAAIESTSESFALWDAGQRLIMCNTKFQEYNGLPADAIAAGTPRATINAMMRQPVSEKRIPNPKTQHEAQTFERQIADNPRWDRRVQVVQVTDTKRDAIEVRLLMSAKDSPTLFDLRCDIREGMLEWLADHQPEAFARLRLLEADAGPAEAGPA